MCGIAGIIDLTGQGRPAPEGAVRAMAQAIIHRGPDEDGFLELPGLSFASRRLSIVGLSDGRQPISNEDGSVTTVFNGELFDYPEVKARLQGRGHVYRTHADTENIVHLWEDHQEGMWDHLKGQFAVALFDRKRRRVVLGRDRFGVCPLYWAKSDGWLLFGSEIKAILASGMIDAAPDTRGINHLFTFLALPGPQTCFAGIQLLPPGHYLDLRLDGPAQMQEKAYWTLEFPDQGDEDRRDLATLTDEFERILLASVERRLRADVEVVSYLSGGVDSSLVVAMASKIRGTPIPAFTLQIKAKGLDETSQAAIVARHVGCTPTVVPIGASEVLNTYPELIRAAEGPVIDTSCAALLLLAREVHRQGYKVALTGEGADEWLAGYPWHKVNRALGYLDVFGLPLSQWIRRAAVWMSGSTMVPLGNLKRAQDAVAGHNGWHDIHGLLSLCKSRFYSEEMKRRLLDVVPLEDMGFDAARMKRWHPLNRELATGARTHLAGLMLNAKGDRVGMNSSVETRYPFIDEEVFSFLAKVPPKYKFKGVFGDKYLLRRVAERWLPREIAWRKKAMFRAPFDSFHLDEAPAFVQQLLSEQSLRKAGYFDAKAVEYWRSGFRSLRSGGLTRTSVEMGLVGVLATQLWHHTFMDGTLCDLPGRSNQATPARSLAGVA